MSHPRLLESRWRTLLMAAGVAVALHALVLSCHHLRKARQGSDEAPRVKDNTPELLRFASASDGPINLKVNALPANPVLPPPPRFSNVSGLQRPGEDRAGGPGRARRRSQRPLSGQEVGAVQRQDARLRTGAVKGAGAAAARKPSRGGSSRGEHAEDWPQAIERLRGAVRQQSAVASGKSSAPLEQPSDGPLAVQAYGRLWELAQPQRLSLSRDALAPALEEMEVRRVPWPAVKDAALSIHHGQTVLLPDAVLLIWLQGDHLYFLRTPREEDRTS
jgi:hypothetical protein